ncbi:MAG: DUF3298 domain-containing protein [Bacteroidales bacterium]|nr:DUF3298 domain-containing protein [Bacteroidales bacterium]MDD3907093.1 DUF3298 domain-containing protein [Bacteroidales bacterium]MDD4713043.1 DUF3298 domain-containing protein [Bacteroidales bacterium]
MRRKLISFSVLPLIVVFAISCKNKPVQEEAQVTFKPFEMNEKNHLKGDEKNPILSISLNLQYPDTFSNVSVLNKIRRTILTDFFPDIEKDIIDPKIAMKTYIKEYIKFYDNSEDASSISDKRNSDQSDVAWWDHEKMIIRNNSENILSYTIESDQFTGGAHGGKNYLNTVINLKTGDRITEDDIFTEASRPLIAEIILKKIMEKHQVSKAEDLEQIGFFDIAEIGLNKNFYVTSEGIVYTYNEYEIAAYAVGTTEVLLSYKDVSGFMIPGNPIIPLIP